MAENEIMNNEVMEDVVDTTVCNTSGKGKKALGIVLGVGLLAGLGLLISKKFKAWKHKRALKKEFNKEKDHTTTVDELLQEMDEVEVPEQYETQD